MRLLAAAVGVVILLLGSCAQPRQPAQAPSRTASARHIDPGNIRRMRRDLPPGYEVTAVSGQAAPPAIWGLGGNTASTPARCAALADPGGGHGQSAQGISGSGAGGILYAVVAAAPSGSVSLDQSLVAQCRTWTMTSRRATARVHLVDAPRIDGAVTLGMATDITTSVEGGNEIGYRANTFTAYLGDYYAFTTLISDPGSPQSPLGPQFAADLLVKTASTLRA
ncbi:DUF5642 family protein [Candidatus Mycobacterium methanotrophicum]|uniref:DUF5642 family protein n=1 Tax=Candidatus Mycobacterium methanotrophicum TaxID=2943498 RepID=A0ABY4QQH9_9MYCO|nr:DUF5642 family protein [Candidatus Mycobacterium methanotrophicum]UQX12141.1 DUF5642 family protein [Candidatus Mycobacterium methanotrophicum]